MCPGNPFGELVVVLLTLKPRINVIITFTSVSVQITWLGVLNDIHCIVFGVKSELVMKT